MHIDEYCTSHKRIVEQIIVQARQWNRTVKATYRSKYCCMEIPGGFMAWNLVTIMEAGSLLMILWCLDDDDDAWLVYINRSNTAAKTRTITSPSAACSGVDSIMLYIYVRTQMSVAYQVFLTRSKIVYRVYTKILPKKAPVGAPILMGS